MAIRLAKSFHKVFYIQPAGLRNPRLSDVKRIRGLLHHRQHRELPSNLYVKRLPFLPIQTIGLAERINGWLLDAFLKEATNSFQEKSVFWVASPAPFLNKSLVLSKVAPLVFDWMDDYTIFRHLPQRVIDMQFRLLRHGDVVFASSKKLLQMARNKGARKAFWLPNGVEPEPWEAVAEARSASDTRESLVKVGYFGTISHWLDRDLIIWLASKRPNWSFVFIGPRADRGALDELFRLKNCRHIPQTDYHLLPGLAASFDVCWVPFKVDNKTSSINPVKVYEYLAMGKPVVAPPLPDLAELGSVLYLAQSRNDWDRLLEKALASKEDFASRRARHEMARRFSWDRVAQKTLDILVELELVGVTD